MKKGKLRKWSVLILALVMVFLLPVAVSAEEEPAASGIKVYVTVSNQGVLATAKDGTAMVKKDVTVTDLNEDGKFTVDEAMVATHEAYFEGGADGYISKFYPEGGYYWVTNLWGVEDNPASYSFFRNDAMTDSVEASEIEDGDELYASVNLDSENWCDYKTQFDVKEIRAAGDEKITVTLTGRVAMGYGTDEPIQGAQIGYWDKGAFTAIQGAVTGADGKATFSMDKKGDYLLTANGKIKGKNPWDDTDIMAPIMAPVSYLTVTSDGIGTADVTVASATYTGKALTPAVTVTLRGKTLTKDTDYTVTFSDNINAGSNAKVTITGKGNYGGTLTKVFTINKAKQPAKIVFKNKTFKAKKLKKKKASYNAVTVKDKQGTVSYKVKYNKKAKKFLKFKKGKVTVKKGAKKGAYKITVLVKIKGNANYLDASMKKKIVVKVK